MSSILELEMRCGTLAKAKFKSYLIQSPENSIHSIFMERTKIQMMLCSRASLVLWTHRLIALLLVVFLLSALSLSLVMPQMEISLTDVQGQVLFSTSKNCVVYHLNCVLFETKVFAKSY